jgi:hypothetical protein
MASSKGFTGARCRFKIGEKFVGYSLGCTGVTGIVYTPIQALGHLEVLEHAPSAYTVEMTSNLSRVVHGGSGTRLSTIDFANTNENSPDGGDVTSPQLMPSFAKDGTPILTSGELTGHIYDRVTASTLYTITGLKAQQKSWDAAGAGAVAENITWVARYLNELNENVSPIGNVQAA